MSARCCLEVQEEPISHYWYHSSLQELADRGSVEDAPQRAGPGGGQGSSEPDSLRRNREGRTLVGRTRGDRGFSQEAGRRRHASGTERETGRNFQDASNGAEGSDRQEYAGDQVGDVGLFLRSGAEGTDHVRSDDNLLARLNGQTS